MVLESDVDSDVIRVPLASHSFVLLDVRDWESEHSTCEFSDGFVWTGRLSSRRWKIQKRHNDLRYAVCTVCRNRELRMHRAIVSARSGDFVDHRDSNGLNNRRGNLRVCTPAQNSTNRRPRINREIRFKGVRMSYGRFTATIYKSGHKFHIGTFDTAESAAAAYDAKAIELFGEFARLNFSNQVVSQCTTAT